MISKRILLNNIDNVKKFCTIANNTEQEIDLVTGRYVIDGKSIMGIFSLDLSKAIECRIHTHDSAVAEVFFNKITNMVIA